MVNRSKLARKLSGMTWSTRSPAGVVPGFFMLEAYIEDNRRNTAHSCGSMASLLKGLTI